MVLTKEEEKVRHILIGTAQGSISTHRLGLIAYSELWKLLSDEPWGQGRRSHIVNLISKVTSYELQNGRPPLNELVVTKRTSLPGEPWPNIRKYHNTHLGIEIPYESHEQAQEACWLYWRTKENVKKGNLVNSEQQADEGVKQDRTSTFRKRNAGLIQARKKLDDHTCQACEFRKKINGIFIIDCHHKNPLGQDDRIRITHISQLACLCPNCHRIAHTRTPPLTPDEIKEALA